MELLIRYTIFIILLLGANVGFTFILNRYLENALLITILSYFSFFLSFMIIYFLFFGFDVKTLFSFGLALLMSILISIFVIIFMSPNYCDKKYQSKIGIYVEVLIYGLLSYLIYFYFSDYVKPFYNDLRIPNRINLDLIFTGIILSFFLVLFIINSFVKSDSFSTLNFYTFLVYLFVVSMKLYVIINQYIFQSTSRISSQLNQEGGYINDVLIREPDYIDFRGISSHKSRIDSKRNNHNKVKSAFYDFH